MYFKCFTVLLLLGLRNVLEGGGWGGSDHSVFHCGGGRRRMITVCPIEVVEGVGRSQCVPLRWWKE